MIENIQPPEKLQALRHWMRHKNRVLVAYSGGVDSSLVLRVATEELEHEALGILAVSPSLPRANGSRLSNSRRSWVPD